MTPETTVQRRWTGEETIAAVKLMDENDRPHHGDRNPFGNPGKPARIKVSGDALISDPPSATPKPAIESARDAAGKLVGVSPVTVCRAQCP
jgi:hypothetical protein